MKTIRRKINMELKEDLALAYIADARLSQKVKYIRHSKCKEIYKLAEKRKQ